MRYRILILFCAGLLLVGEAAAAGRRQVGDMGAELARADSLIAAGDFDAALQLTQSLWMRCQSSPLYSWQCAGRLGLTLHRSGRSEEAVGWLETAVRIEPLAPEAHLNFAAALMAVGSRGRAYSEYQQAVDLDPDNWRFRLDFGQALAEFRQYGRAMPHLEAALDLCGGCAEAVRALAAATVNSGDFAGALPWLERLRASSPDPALRPLLARALYESGRPRDCLDLLAPEWPDGLSADERAMVLVVDRDLGLVDRSLDIVARLGRGDPGPEDGSFWSQVSQILIDGGRDAEALAATGRALEVLPGDPVLENNRAALRQRLGLDVD